VGGLERFAGRIGKQPHAFLGADWEQRQQDEQGEQDMAGFLQHALKMKIHPAV
jgi:hypothetical protein